MIGSLICWYDVRCNIWFFCKCLRPQQPQKVVKQWESHQYTRNIQIWELYSSAQIWWIPTKRSITIPSFQLSKSGSGFAVRPTGMSKPLDAKRWVFCLGPQNGVPDAMGGSSLRTDGYVVRITPLLVFCPQRIGLWEPFPTWPSHGFYYWIWLGWSLPARCGAC